MRRGLYIFVLGVLVFVVVLALLNIWTYLKFSDRLDPSVSFRVPQDTADLSLIVEVAPSESPAISVGAGAGSGGGSSVVPVSSPTFSVITEELNIFIVDGQTELYNVIIKNDQATGLNISVAVSGLDDIVALSTTSLTLKGGEEIKVPIIVVASGEGVRAGRIIFTSGDVVRETFVLINVKSVDSLFDVSLSLPKAFTSVLRGDVIRAFISLIQVGEEEEVDVVANYFVKDFDGETHFISEETFSVFKSKSFSKEFETEHLYPGDYVVGVEITYPGGFASSSSHFVVDDRIIDLKVLVIIILGVLSFLAVVYSISRYKKSKKYVAKRRVRKRK